MLSHREVLRRKSQPLHFTFCYCYLLLHSPHTHTPQLVRQARIRVKKNQKGNLQLVLLFGGKEAKKTARGQNDSWLVIDMMGTAQETKTICVYPEHPDSFIGIFSRCLWDIESDTNISVKGQTGNKLIIFSCPTAWKSEIIHDSVIHNTSSFILTFPGSVHTFKKKSKLSPAFWNELSNTSWYIMKKILQSF